MPNDLGLLRAESCAPVGGTKTTPGCCGPVGGSTHSYWGTPAFTGKCRVMYSLPYLRIERAILSAARPV